MRKLLAFSILAALAICVFAAETVTNEMGTGGQEPQAVSFNKYTLGWDEVQGSAYADMNGQTVSMPEIFGYLDRIVINTVGTDTAFTIKLTDEQGVVLFNKTDCNTTTEPHSYALYEDDTEGNPWRGIPIGGICTIDTDAIGLNAEVQTLAPDANSTAGPFKLTYNGQTTTAIDEVVTISEANEPNGGNFTLTWGGQTTGSIPYSATATAIDVNMEALSNIAADEVVCTGGPLPDTPVVITFDNGLGESDQGAITWTDVDMTVSDSNYGAYWDITVTTAGDGLVYDTNIAYIEDALDALSSVDDGDIEVTGEDMSTNAGTSGTIFTFLLADGDVNLMTIDGTYLTGPSTLGLTQTTKGGSTLTSLDIIVFYRKYWQQ